MEVIGSGSENLTTPHPPLPIYDTLVTGMPPPPRTVRFGKLKFFRRKRRFLLPWTMTHNILGSICFRTLPDPPIFLIPVARVSYIGRGGWVDLILGINQAQQPALPPSLYTPAVFLGLTNTCCNRNGLARIYVGFNAILGCYSRRAEQIKEAAQKSD